MEDVVIVQAGRSPVGSFMGSLSSLSAAELGAQVIKGVLERAGVSVDEVDEVILGQVLTAAAGMNPARQATLMAGLPHRVPAMIVNQVCGSGLRSVALAAQAIRCGDAETVLCGGQESMSQAPHALPRSRAGKRMGPWQLEDTMIKDGLWDAFNDCHMGITAENIVKKFGFSREAQDVFAAASQRKAGAAIAAGRFVDEIVPIEIPQRHGDPLVIEQDEGPRPDISPEALARLSPAFDKQGSVTAGNASGINDGAAILLLMPAARAKRLDLAPLAHVKAYASSGVDPAIMGTGPIPAVRRCLERAGWTIEQLDLIEANEAFAAQAMSVNQELGWDPDKINVNGGAIAIGHPIGASGARILVTLLHEMRRRQARRGLATLCVGGGMGVALAVERPD